MNHYLPQFVAPIEETLQALARILGVQSAPEWTPVLGPLREDHMGPPESVDGHTFGSGETIDGRHFVNGTWVGLEHRIEQGPCEGALLQGLILEHCSKWASRCYRMGPANRIRACAFVNVKPEHAVYWNLRGTRPDVASFVLRNSLFLDIESQALQLVYRRSEQGFDFEAAGDGAAGGEIIVADCLVRNAGWGIGDGNARAAFALSFFSSPHSGVRVVRSIVDKSMQAKSTGCLLVQAFPRAFVGSSAFLSGEATQPVLKFEGTRHVELIGSAIFAGGGQAWVSFDGCGGAIIHGCRGNVRVHWNRQDVGAITDTLVLGDAADDGS